MLRKRKQVRRWTFLGGQSVTINAAALTRPDRGRQIDAVIDYFGGARESGTSCLAATVVRSRTGYVFITDGPFAETKEQIGGSHVGAPAAGSGRPPHRPV